MKELAARAFTIGVWLVGLSVLLQVLLAGLGVFTDPSFFFWHAAVNSTVVGLLPLLLVLIGWLAGVPVRIRWLCAAVTGLVAVQSLLLFPYHMNAQGALRAISSLHVLNAILIFWVALTLLERTRAWSQGGTLVVEERP
jgi:Family of unknown function (DUF6220)